MREGKEWAPLMSFRVGCLIVCGIHVFFGAMILLRGPEASLVEFKVPTEILQSAHYKDAIWWVYSHQLIMGLLIGCVGWYAESHALKLQLSRVLFLAHSYYTWLDISASDSALGSALYKGPASLIPAFVALFCTLIFLYLSIAYHNPPKD